MSRAPHGSAKKPFAGLYRSLAGRLGDAMWIWGGGDPRPVNSYRLFRREFSVRRLPQSVSAWCYAEFRYKLFVNGCFVQFGPTPCDPNHRLVSRHEIAPFLREGRNCVAFVVYCPGLPTGLWTMVNAGLLCYVRSDDGLVDVASDGSWQTRRGDAWIRPTEICGYGKGFAEWHHAAKMPQRWSCAGAGKVGWEQAEELPYFPHGDPDDMKENYAGNPTLDFHTPVSCLPGRLVGNEITQEMVAQTNDRYRLSRMRWERLMGKWHPKCALADNELMPEPITSRIALGDFAPAPAGMIRATEGGVLPLSVNVADVSRDVVLSFDLGVVRSGLIAAEIESASGGTVDFAGGDRISDGGKVIRDLCSQQCDRLRVPAGRASWESMVERGWRYVQVVLRGFHGVVTIRRLGIVETLTQAPTGPAATFESSDDLLNSIWRASAETVRLYMNGCGHGDPWRERSAWFGDSWMAGRMAYYCFQDWRLYRRSLELAAQAQRADGSFPVVHPGMFEDFNMILISCPWVARIAEYAALTGDKRFAGELLPCVERHTAYELRYADGAGLLYETPGRRFLSWADGAPRTPYRLGEIWTKTGRKAWGDFFDPPTRGYNAIINIAWLWCLREAASLAASLGARALATRWGRMFRRARRAFDAMFWEPQTGLYRDNVAFDAEGKANPPAFCESTLFHMIAAGLVDGRRGLDCLQRLRAPDFVCCRSSGGLELSAVPPFLIAAGRATEAIDLWKDLWGNPILAGATTSGEEFFRSAGNSDCHIHGAAPARDFIEHLAGVRFTGPLWSEVVLAPPPDGPDLTCSVPTPAGDVRVTVITDAGGRRIARYSIPRGCKGFQLKGGVRQPLKHANGEMLIRHRDKAVENESRRSKGFGM